MKIKSNKTFNCYETAYENWNSGKDITLDGIKLIPITIFDKIRAEIRDWQTDIHDNEYDAETHDFVFERIYEIIDEYKTESKE